MTKLVDGCGVVTSGPAERTLTGVGYGTFQSGNVLHLGLDVGHMAAYVNIQ